MAHVPDTSVAHGVAFARIRAAVAGFGARLARAGSVYAAAQSRQDEFTRLNALSDEQLAELHLRREDIARYVFRDLIGF